MALNIPPSGVIRVSRGNFDPTRFRRSCANDPHSEIDVIRLVYAAPSIAHWTSLLPDVLPGHCARRRHRNDHHRGPRGCLPRTGLCGAPMI